MDFVICDNENFTPKDFYAVFVLPDLLLCISVMVTLRPIFMLHHLSSTQPAASQVRIRKMRKTARYVCKLACFYILLPNPAPLAYQGLL